MKKTQKWAAAMMAMIMAAGLTACGGANSSKSGTTTTAATSTASSGETAASDGEVYEFIYSGTVPDTHPMSVAFYEIKDELEEKSSGRLIMSVYTNNTLGDSRANIEGMQGNSVQMGEVSSAPLAIFTDKFMPMSLPFFFSDKQNAYDFCESDFMNQLEDQLASEIGVRPVGWFLNGERCLTNNVRAVDSPDDMKGMKIRVMENDIYLKTFEALGASPTTMSFAEVFTALQQGTVNGQDNPTAITVSNKFYEVQKYFTDLHHVIDMAPILVSEEWYQSLPDDLKKIFDEAVVNCVERERSLMDENTESDYKTIATTCEVTRLTDDQRAAFKDSCNSVYDWFNGVYTDIDLQSYIDAAGK